MPSVVVDLEDLEALVITSGALKTIEGALAARKNDPFVRPHLEFTAAHDRLASAMRNARRADADTLVKWDGELEDEEVKMLRAVDGGGFWISREDKAPQVGEDMSIADRLAAKGCIVIGQFVTGVVFAGSPHELQIDAKGFPLRITQRGREKLAKITAAKIPQADVIPGKWP